MKLKGPLLSQQAQKTLGGLLEFSLRHGKNLLRFHQQPTGAASSEQTTQQGYYTEAAEAWATLLNGEKQQWHDYNKS